MHEGEYQFLQIVGATANPGPEELPHFLDPICVDEKSPDNFFIAHVSPWDGRAPQLYRIAKERLHEEAEAGFWRLFDHRLPFHWNFRLVALEQGKLPAYLPAEEAYSRVRELGTQALERANQQLDEGVRKDDTKNLLWYAARAIPNDPFPLLAAIAFDRDNISDEMITDLSLELPRPSHEQSELTIYAQQRNWLSLLTLIESDPLGVEYKNTKRNSSFLAGIPNEADFFSKFQRSFVLIGRKAAA
jgi:hypothetical protein